MQHDIEAEITFLPTEHGGRSGPVFSGYRPQFYYDGHDWDARYEYPNHKQVQLGQKIVAYISFLSPREHVDKIYLGMAFLLREGNRIVGYGVVTKIVNLYVSAATRA